MNEVHDIGAITRIGHAEKELETAQRELRLSMLKLVAFDAFLRARAEALDEGEFEIRRHHRNVRKGVAELWPVSDEEVEFINAVTRSFAKAAMENPDD